VCWGRKERKGRLKDEQGATQIEHSQEAQRQEAQRQEAQRQEAQRQEAQRREAQWLRERERRSKQHQMAAELLLPFALTLRSHSRSRSR
jgi:V/A-type H+-transporting ATPase subunit D